MKSVFVNVTTQADGADISGIIERFKFDDSTEKDDLVTITIKNSYSLDAADNIALAKGQYVRFYFGYIGGKQSAPRLAKITRNERVYDGRVVTTITATDQGIDMKKNSSNTVWKDISSRGIVQAIASARGMGYSIDLSASTTKHASYPQGNKSDMDFLKELATKEPGGQFRVFVKGKVIHYEPRPLEQESSRTVKIGDSEVISFRPRIDDNETSAAAGDYQQVAIDPESGEVVTSEKEESTKLGKRTFVFNQDAFIVGVPLVNNINTGKAGAPFVSTETKKNVPSPDPNQDNLNNESTNKTTGSELGGMTAELSMEGDPVVQSDIIITIAGQVAKADSGNWLVTNVAHDLSPGSAYTMTMGLKKNASNATVSNAAKEAEKTNETKGADNPGKKIRVYDGNSNVVSGTPFTNFNPITG